MKVLLHEHIRSSTRKGKQLTNPKNGCDGVRQGLRGGCVGGEVTHVAACGPEDEGQGGRGWCWRRRCTTSAAL